LKPLTCDRLPTTSAELQSLRATRAIVDLDAIAGNVRAIRSLLPEKTEIMAVVKADGYGHGAMQVARIALDAGATSLGVATVSEGCILRAEGIRAPIVVLGSVDPTEASLASRLGLELTVAHAALLDALRCAVRDSKIDVPVGVHLKIDTGLRRYGALASEAKALAMAITEEAGLRLAGIYTHFASADEPDEPFTDVQLERFSNAVAAIRESGVPTPRLHAANSAGILMGRGVELDIVRLGIALYGVPPSAEVPLLPGMRPAMRIESRIARVFSLFPGDTVGYNRTFRAERPMRGALVPIGYADGYRRSLSGNCWVGVNGHRAPVLGRVSMDQMVVEVPDGCPAAIGDIVHVMSDDPAHAAPQIGNLAQLMETNTYEVLVGFRQRLPRVYVQNGIVVSVRTHGALAVSALD
jgi:alanine racemase